MVNKLKSNDSEGRNKLPLDRQLLTLCTVWKQENLTTRFNKVGFRGSSIADIIRENSLHRSNALLFDSQEI